VKSLFQKTIAILAVSACLLDAQQNPGLTFLKIDVDARAAAMAGAYTAMSNDASAAYWNPAGLALAQDLTFTGMYNDLFAGITHSFLAVQFLTGSQSMALSFNYQNIPGIPIRDTATDEPAGTVEAFYLATALSYATTYEEWQVGASLKYLFEKLYLVSAPGWAIDLGVFKKNFFAGVDFGFVVQNLGKMSELQKEATKLPLIVNSGLTYKIPSFFDDNLLVSTDLQWVKDEKLYAKFGLQYYLTENFVLRGGLKNGIEELLWSGGFGINYNSLHLDYAYAPFEYDLGTSSRLSLGLSF
jgi:Type IX secretion system protein PorV